MQDILPWWYLDACSAPEIPMTTEYGNLYVGDNTHQIVVGDGEKTTQVVDEVDPDAVTEYKQGGHVAVEKEVA
jgi:hypothetical protein